MTQTQKTIVMLKETLTKADEQFEKGARSNDCEKRVAYCMVIGALEATLKNLLADLESGVLVYAENKEG